mmetsp:Transcript_2243/g.5069  ORF Transcript_2243/g.5069 Transcript_2243/m.5069 type:complete len:144 (-) Transcript_2243:100-531(-)
MAVSADKIKLEEKGEFKIMNNTPKQWGVIIGLLLLLYLCLSLFMYGLLEIALETRNNDYMTMPDIYYGAYESMKQPSGGWKNGAGWSRPNGCEYGKVPAELASGKDNIECKGDKWAIFPWVQATANKECEGKTMTILGKCTNP